MDNFFGRGYTNDPPPLGELFYSSGCVSFCSAPTQQEADDCAARQNILCVGDNWPLYVPPPPNSPPGTPGTYVSRQSYLNTAQTCIKTCPGGTIGTFTVPAGTIRAFSQAEADAEAYSRACNEANLNTICMSPLSQSRICLLSENSISISASNVFITTNFAVVAGSLPPELYLVNTGFGQAEIQGTAVVVGFFPFTIGVVDGTGEYSETNYTIEVLGITNNSPLPNAVENTPYSQTITMYGLTDGSWSFSITSGALPIGMTLNSVTGIISGTPTVDGNYTFTIQVEDES